MANSVLHKIYLPRENTSEETLKSYGSVERAVILEIAERFAIAGKAQYGDNFFDALMARDDHFEYRREWRNQWDPMFLFGEILRVRASPIAHCLPRVQLFINNFDKCRRTRNLWAHDFYPRNLNDLAVDIVSFKMVSSLAGLRVAPYIDMVTARIIDIRNGTWPPAVVPAVAPEDEVEIQTAVPAAAQADFDTSDRRRELERDEKRHAPVERPVVGSRWVGDAPTRRVRLQAALSDVVDSVTGSSLRDEMGDHFDETVARWVTLRPNGDLLIDDYDNAVMGWVGGTPRLIGYLGPEPAVAEGEIRGFLHHCRYTVADGSVTDVDSGRSLEQVAAVNAEGTTRSIIAAFNPADELYITTYGDVVRVCDEGIIKIVTVSPAEGAAPASLDS